MLALRAGQMTSKARNEIVHAVAIKMINYCRIPSTTQIEVVASKIVLALGDVAKDCMGIGYVSCLH